MRLTQPFLKLPIAFDASALAAEVNALPDSAWVLHPNKFPGNEAVRLITPGGQQTDAARRREMLEAAVRFADERRVEIPQAARPDVDQADQHAGRQDRQCHRRQDHR